MVSAATARHHRRALAWLLGLILSLAGCSKPPAITPTEWVRSFVDARRDPTRCAEIVTPQLGFVCGNVSRLGYLDAQLTPDGSVTVVWRVGHEQRAAVHEGIRLRMAGGRVTGFDADFLPLWLLEPVEIRADERVLVLAGRDFPFLD